MDIREFIKEEVKRLHKKTLKEDIFTGGYINPAALADVLVQAGVIKDEYTDLSGQKASSKLAFIVKKAVDKVKDI